MNKKILQKVLREKERFGRSTVGQGKKILVTLVSAAPIRPLTVDEGRAIIFGSTVATLLEAIGFDVDSEFLLYGFGREMDVFAVSIWLRYLDLAGEELAFPINANQEDYIWDIGAFLHREYSDKFFYTEDEIFNGIVNAEFNNNEKTTYLDHLITKAKELLDVDRYRLIMTLGMDLIAENIQRDLNEFGVNYQNRYSAQHLIDKYFKNRAIIQRKNISILERKSDSLKSGSDITDEDDTQRQQYTNEMVDTDALNIAYLKGKFNSGYNAVVHVELKKKSDKVADIKLGMETLDYDENKFCLLSVESSDYFHDNKHCFDDEMEVDVTLRGYRETVGRDLARYNFLSKPYYLPLGHDSKKSDIQDIDQPLEAIYSAYARICGILCHVETGDLSRSDYDFTYLADSVEEEILEKLSEFPQCVELAALNHEPHQIKDYLQGLAALINAYCSPKKTMKKENEQGNFNSALCLSSQWVLKNGLDLLGISAPQGIT